MKTHYEKYKETIKKVARRNYRKRVAWLNNHLGEQFCTHCDESRKEVHRLMNECKVVCSNCWIKLDNDLIEFL